MSVYGYVRVSTMRQANEGESLEVQQRQLEGYALMHALTIDEVVVEEGVSGSVPVMERPKGGKLFARLERGDIVIAAKLDHLYLGAQVSRKAAGLALSSTGAISGNGLSKLFLTMRRTEAIGSAKVFSSKDQKRVGAISAASSRLPARRRRGGLKGTPGHRRRCGRTASRSAMSRVLRVTR